MKTRILRTLFLLHAAALAAQATPPPAPSSAPVGDEHHPAKAGGPRHHVGNHGMMFDDGMMSDGDGMRHGHGDHRRLLPRLAALDEREFILSRGASTRASAPAIRAFAEEMLRGHAVFSADLAALAERKNVPLAAMPREKIDELEKNWAAKSGREYDEDYLDAMVDALASTLAQLDRCAGSPDADVAAFANKARPDIQARLQRAKELRKTLD